MKMNRINVLSMFLALTSAAAATSAAYSAEMSSVQVPSSFWQDVQDLVVRCSIRPFAYNQNGKKVYGNLKSTCSELSVEGLKASFTLYNTVYSSEIDESPSSDGGDLYNVAVFGSDQVAVARRSNVPAFGDALLALSVDENQIPEALVPELQQ